jgi:hypothetical protein
MLLAVQIDMEPGCRRSRKAIGIFKDQSGPAGVVVPQEMKAL